MEELAELRQHILNGDYTTALSMIDELDEMSRKAVLRNLRNYLIRLLIHLVKNQVEGHLTNSWVASIRHSILEIQDINQMENNRAFYIKPDEWEGWLEDALDDAIYAAAPEVNGGVHTPYALATLVDKAAIMISAQMLLAQTYHTDRRQMAQQVDQFLYNLPGGQVWEHGTK